jgi:hypothetical protein
MLASISSLVFVVTAALAQTPAAPVLLKDIPQPPSHGSYFRAAEGTIYTVSQTGVFAAKRNLFKPLHITGANYFQFANGVFGAVAQDGGIYTYPGTTYSIDQYGGNFFFLKESRELYIVKNDALPKPTGKSYSAVSVTGENYFFLTSGTVVTVDPAGYYYEKDKITLPQQKCFGGRYFFGPDGLLTTVAQNGVIEDEWDAKQYRFAACPTVLGGNYFIEADGTAWIVRANGAPLKVTLPIGPIALVGPNFLVETSGQVTTFDRHGFFYPQAEPEKKVKNPRFAFAVSSR